MHVRDAREWAEIRSKGRGRFVLERGVLKRGLPLGALIAIALELYLGGQLPGALLSSAFLGRLALCCGVFSATGSLNASLVWGICERRFGQG